MTKAKRKNPAEIEISGETPSPEMVTQQTSTQAYFWIGIALLGIALVARLRLLDIPFERDEGVFAYIGQALWNGKSLYSDLYDNKLPGLYLIYGLFAKGFGVQPFGIHLGMLLWQIPTLAVFFLWLKGIIGRDRAMASTGLFALYASSAQVLGFAAHATQLCALPAIAGMWALWHGTRQAPKTQALWIFLGGLGAGLAIWVKQQALFYAVFGGLFLVWHFWGPGRSERVSRGIGMGFLYALGVFLPLGLSAAWYAAQGHFDDFWFWTVEISTGETSNTQAPGAGFFFNFYFPKVILHWWWVWFSGIYGLIWALRQKDSPQLKALATLLPFSLWGVSLGGAFYPHYFVLALPWLALCSVLALDVVHKKYGKYGFWLSCTLVFLWPVLAHRGYWFQEDHRTILRRAYDNNPFQEMANISAELKKRCAPEDKIAIIGSEPELFLYTERSSALSHLFFQGVVQPHKRKAQFQQQIREELWGGKPRFVVLPGAQYEHLKDDPLVKEIVDRLPKDYHTVCVVDIMEDHSQITWDPSPEQALPKTLYWVLVMERN